MNTTNYKAPDLHGTRYRPTAYKVTNDSFYNEFYKKYPQYKKVSRTTLLKIIDTFNTKLWEEVISNHNGIELPEALGTVCAVACRTKKKEIINFNLSNKLGKRVHLNNFETNGLLVKVVYTNFKNKYNFFGKQVWIFIACRDFKRSLSKSFREYSGKYLQIGMHERFSKHKFIAEDEPVLDSNYDPLSL